MREARSSMALLVAVVVCVAWACRSTGARRAIDRPTQAYPSTTPTSPPQRLGYQADDGSSVPGAEGNPPAGTLGAQRVLDEMVYFDFDRSDLTDAARHGLDAKLEILTADRSARIRIEGHADARGPAQYNLALGRRRAMAARRYLVQRNIQEQRIEVATWGEARPVCRELGESCWKMNRRAEFVMIEPQTRRQFDVP